MHQTICIAILLSVVILANASLAAQMTSDGNWGGAISNLLSGSIIAILYFYLVHSLIYYPIRFLRGRSSIAAFSATKLNYIAFVIALLGILGAAARYVTPP